MSNIIGSFRLALRSLRRDPAFTLLVISAWAIGIGVTTALFSIYQSVLLQPLPYRDSGNLVFVYAQGKGGPQTRASYATYIDWQQQKEFFTGMAVFRGWSPTLVGNGDAEPLHGMRAAANFFDVLAVQPFLGRFFVPEEDTPNNTNAVVLSYGLWQRRFGEDRNIIDKTILLNSKPFKVVGVLPSNFNPAGLEVLGHRPEIWAPLGYSLSLPVACRDCRHLQVIARLKSIDDIAQANAQLTSLQRVLDEKYPSAYAPGTTVSLLPLKEAVIGNVRLMFTILLGSVFFLLLLVCANVSHLLLLRVTKQSRDIAVRTALGARRRDIIKGFLAESTTVAVLGGAIGFALAIAAVKAIVLLAPSELPRIDELSVDVAGFGFAMIVSFFVGALSGLAPSLTVPNLNLQDFLKTSNRNSGSMLHALFRKVLMVTEVGLALSLMISAGLFTKSYIRVTEINPGFDSAGVLSLSVSTQGQKYNDDKVVYNFFQQVVERARSVPGARAAALVSTLPISGDFDQFNICVEGKMLCTAPSLPSADRYVITPDYLQVMHIPLIKGRNFNEQDQQGSTPVALVGQSFARQLFQEEHAEDAMGHRIQAGGTWYTVVGVVGDVRQYGLDSPITNEFYVSFAQQPRSAATLLVRSDSDPMQMVSPIKREIAGIDSTQPVYDPRPMQQLLLASTAHRRFVMLLAGVFGVFALLLATMGVYGVVSYSVTQRTQEMGVRMALGAKRVAIFSLIVKQAALLIAIGLAAGLLGAVALSRLFGTLLFSVTAFDPLILTVTTLGLLAVALMACFLPAMRATAVDPVIALRYE